jgi:hypothetical protein
MQAFRPVAVLTSLALAACGGSSGGSLFGGGAASGGAGTGGASPFNAPGMGGQLTTAGGASASGAASGAPGGGGAGLFAGSGGLPSGNGANTGAGGLPGGSGGAGGRGGAGTSAGGVRTLDAGPPPAGDAGRGVPGGPSPGVIFCAGIQCAIAGTPTNTCCVGAPPFPTQCMPSFPGCSVTSGFGISCDDTTDCLNGQICCGALSGPSAGSRCAVTCDASSFQLCRADSQCPSKACRPIAAAPAYDACL